MTDCPTGRRARIATAFAQARGYEAAATVQRRAADLLAERIAAAGLPRTPRILELGCGTGFLSRAIDALVAPADWTISDIAPAMVARARQETGIDADYRVIDGEAVDPELGRFDLIASSMAFQWFADLPAALARLEALLNPGGLIAFSTMAEGSLDEWRTALAGDGHAAGTPRYPSQAALDAGRPAGTSGEAELVDIREAQRDARDFLRRLKAIGAGVPDIGYRPVAPAALRRAMARFDAGPRIVTYRIGFCLFRKG